MVQVSSYGDLAIDFQSLFRPEPDPRHRLWAPNPKISTKIGEIILAGIAGLAYVGFVHVHLMYNL